VLQSVCSDGLLDVLDLLGSEIGKVERHRFAYIPISDFREADATWISKAFQPGGYVYAIPEQIASAHHHVADVDSDSKLKALGFRLVLIGGCKRVLHLNGTLNGINGAGELRQDAVSGCVGNPPTMLDNQAIHDFAVCRQSAKGARLILVHEPGVTSDIGGKNGR
jgi:hypothetical protein